jgi:hypothetical protein
MTSENQRYSPLETRNRYSARMLLRARMAASVSVIARCRSSGWRWFSQNSGSVSHSSCAEPATSFERGETYVIL